MADFADYYREIYIRGLGGEAPVIPVAVAELEERACEAMDPKAANYVFAGAGSEGTMRANREAFARCRQSRPLDRATRHYNAGTAAAGADRRAESGPRGWRAGHGARSGGARPADDRQHQLALHLGGNCRGGRRGAALVPALLAQ